MALPDAKVLLTTVLPSTGTTTSRTGSGFVAATFQEVEHRSTVVSFGAIVNPDVYVEFEEPDLQSPEDPILEPVG